MSRSLSENHIHLSYLIRSLSDTLSPLLLARQILSIVRQALLVGLDLIMPQMGGEEYFKELPEIDARA